MSLTVFLLDYKRFPNILHHILPSLLNEGCINQIIIAHANTDYINENDEHFPLLQADAIDITNMNGKQIIRIQDSKLNDTYQCFRRWIWLNRLLLEGVIQNSYILTHDDDFVFMPGEIEQLLQLKLQNKGRIICGEGGRSFSGTTYSFRQIFARCNIAVGQSMLLEASSILDAYKVIQKAGIPPEILHEDDIVMSLLIGEGNAVHFGARTKKKYFTSPDARFLRPNHIALRIRTGQYIMQVLKVSSSKPNYLQRSHSPSTTDDMLLTSDPIDL